MKNTFFTLLENQSITDKVATYILKHENLELKNLAKKDLEKLKFEK